MSKILIIDDDLEICSLVKRALEKEGHQVTSQPDPIQAETMPLDLFDFLILLDVMMPGKDGFTLFRDIRERVDCPILFLTAKTEECDLMQGLGNGGDDYITKPFGIGRAACPCGGTSAERDAGEKAQDVDRGISV